MKISYNVLKWYIDPLPTAEELEQRIIFGAFEVEGKETVGDDTVFEIKTLPDRNHDCLSHQGMAREIAGLLGAKYIDPTEKFTVPASISTQLEVAVDTNLCRRYMARIIRNVKIGPSPKWMTDHLESMGQRSINNIVDATNLVMFDCGQPIHAFDAKKLASEKIIIKQLEKEGIITTLTDEEKTLQIGDMVIADEANILAIAGVKGGKHAEVDDATADIVIEVANFDPVAVRKTARRLNIFTDSAKRFENELTPELASYAMRELSATIAEMCPNAVFEDIVDFYPEPVQQKTVEFTADYINEKLGTNITVDEIAKILMNYSYVFTENGGVFVVTIPFARIDITAPHDMIEEIGRAYGYEKIVATIPSFSHTPEINPEFAKISAVKADLTAKGYHEVMTYTFGKKGDFEVARGAVGKSALRTKLEPGIKESYELNRLNKELLEIDDMKVFEIGTVFPKSGEIIHVAYSDKKGATEMTLDEYVEKNNLNIDSYNLSDDTLSSMFKMWSDYPYISRDIAVWVPELVSVDNVQELIRSNATDLLVRGPRLFDTFTKEGKTSYAFRMVFQSYDRTLTEEEINQIMTIISQSLVEKGWEVR